MWRIVTDLVSASWVMPALLAAGVAAVALWHYSEIREAEAAVYAKWGASNAKRLEEANQTERDHRAEEKRRSVAQQGVIDEAIQARELALRDAARADAAAGQLQQRIAATAARARQAACHPAALVDGAPADDPIGVLADVLGRADARAGVLAEFADQAHIAGTACERQYDALKP